MNIAANFGICIAVDTALGFRCLTYDAGPISTPRSKSGFYIYTGLGAAAGKGKWITVTRDLSADLRAGESNNTLIAVNGFYVRGNLRLTGIGFSNAGPVAQSASGISKVTDTSQIADSISISWSSSELKQFGNPVAGFGLANQLVGRAHATKSGTRQVAFAFVPKTSWSVASVRQYVIWSTSRAGYQEGTGGLVRIDLVTDQGGNPGNNVMATGTYQPNIGGAINDHFSAVQMSGSQLSCGQNIGLNIHRSILNL